MTPARDEHDLTPPFDLQGTVAITGPKGGGKSIYRTYLYAQAGTELPVFMQQTLGVTQADWPGQGFELRLGADGWKWQAEEHVERRASIGAYLPELRPTEHLTRHQLSLPRVGDGAPESHGFVLDFPGNFWTRPEWDSQDAAEYVTRNLRPCRMILFMLPFWILLPRSWRHSPSPLERARRSKQGFTQEQIDQERMSREADLVSGTREWLRRLAPVRTGEGRRPTIVVCMTMIHREWRHELASPVESGDSARARILHRLARIRRMINDPLARDGRPAQIPTASWQALLPSVASGVGNLWSAVRMRRLLAVLNDEVRGYVGDVRAAVSDAEGQVGAAAGDAEDESLREMLEGLCALEDPGQPHKTRWIGMNVVGERSFALRRPEAVSTGALLSADDSNVGMVDQLYLPREVAGAMLPTVYLCSCLDGAR
jgi:hypothetical protein